MRQVVWLVALLRLAAAVGDASAGSEAVGSGTVGAFLDASPNPVPDGSGLGSTTISWDTGNGGVGEVWVDDRTDAPGEVLFARAPSGGQGGALRR